MTPPDPDIHEIAREQAVLKERVATHDRVLDDIRSHLNQLVTEAGKFRLVVCVVGAMLLAGSPTGHDLLVHLLG